MAALTTRGSVDAALPSAGLEITTRTLSTSALPTGIPLLTRWSYPADCTQWLTFDPILGLANDPAIPTAFAVNYYSPRTLTADVDRGLWTMPSHTGYATCYPYSSSLPEGELYSPGICPDGQLIAGAVTENHYVITPNNTTVTRFEGKCCRSGMTDNGRDCERTYSPTIVATLPLTYTSINDGTTFTNTFWTGQGWTALSDSGSFTDFIVNKTTLAPGLALSPPVSVAWQITDLDTFPTGYASSLAKKMLVDWTAGAFPTATQSTTPILPSETSTSVSETSSPASLTTRAKAGIGIGAALGFLLLISLILYLVLRRHKQHQRTSQTPEEDGILVEMEDHDQDLTTWKWLLGGKWRSEVRAEREPGELDGRVVHVVMGEPVELDGCERVQDAEGRT